jgi:uncharacterized protein (DUF1501 family)
MTEPAPLSRRRFLGQLAACSAAAHPALTSVTLAATSADAAGGATRFVVIILRGALDGLDVLQPREDPQFQILRPTLGRQTGTHPLTGGFHLHPAAAPLLPLWAAGELAFVPATATPYRDGRSHFDGQDLLEAGTAPDAALPRDGWLNRALGLLPDARAETAYAVGREALPLLAGPAPAMEWAPDQDMRLSAQARLLLAQVHHDDPLFAPALDEALTLTSGSLSDDTLRPGSDGARVFRSTDALVDFAAARLRADTRIAAFSLSGWDTHRNQVQAIAGPVATLSRAIARLAAAVGPDIWGQTVLLAMTEFGRTVRENGSRGTDHGTGGLMLAAGGAVAGGRLHGAWPGLGEGALYDDRDLMPTSDVRAWAGDVLGGLFGIGAGAVDTTVFPGLDRTGAGRLLR